MSFKSRDLTVKLSGAEEGKCGCTPTPPGCGACTPTNPGCQHTPNDNNACTDTKTTTGNYEEDPPAQSAAGLALLRQQLQETLGTAP